MKVIVCVPDLQAPFHVPKMVDNLAAFIKSFKPTTVVSVGDEIDLQTISKWSRGTILEYEGSIGKDRDTTVDILERLQISHMARSNHTDRLFNYISLKAPGLLGLPELTLENFLKLPELGITLHDDPYELAPGWLLMHGDEGSQNSTAGMTALGLAKRTNMSVVCGHTHRQASVPFTQAYTGGEVKTIYGFEVGNLMDYSKAKYIKAGMTNWQHGFGLLYVDGKTVTPVSIPIQNDGSFIADGFRWGK